MTIANNNYESTGHTISGYRSVTNVTSFLLLSLPEIGENGPLKIEKD